MARPRTIENQANQFPTPGKSALVRHGSIIAGILGFAAAPASAELLTYEGFNYTPGQTLAATEGKGGSGWAFYWSNNGSNIANGIIRAASLNGNQSIATSGHSFTNGNGAIYTRAFANNLGTPGSPTTRWISLFYLGNSAVGNESRIGFYGGMGDGDPVDGHTTTASGGLPHPFDVGRTNAENLNTGGDTICLYLGNVLASPFVSSGVATPRGSVAAFLLLKFELGGDTSADTVRLWVNPVPSAGEGALGPAQAIWTTGDMDVINGMRLQSNGSGGLYTIDEIRVGTTFADVTPPAPTGSGQITSTVISAFDVKLTWDSFGDSQNYTVETSLDMSPGSWTPTGPVITDGVLTATAPLPPEPKAFFRVVSPNPAP